jgi:hypothetical protein
MFHLPGRSPYPTWGTTLPSDARTEPRSWWQVNGLMALPTARRMPW